MKKLGSLIASMLMIFSLNAYANLPYFPIELPKDHAAHFANTPYPVNHMMEWWYYNGTVTAKNGKKLGYFISYLYVQRISNGKKLFLPVMQVQVTDIEKQKVYGGQIYFSSEKTHLSTDKLDIQYGNDFNLKEENNSFVLNGKMKNVSYSLTMTPKREVLLPLGRGLIDMGDNTNSYYYSYTQVATSGQFTLDNETYEIDPAKSLSWMDHQWGDFIVLPEKSQWMWASIQLENNLEINIAATIDRKTHKTVGGMASIVMPDNKRIYLNDMKQFTYLADPVRTGERHPRHYHITIPDIRLALEIEALAPNQDINGVWEGASTVDGVFENEKIKGQANTENTVMY